MQLIYNKRECLNLIFWKEWVNLDQNLIGFKIICDLGDKAEWAKYWISLKFGALEKLLSKTSGKCCVGDEITIADICLVPQVFNAHRFGIDTNQFPIINRINKHLLQNKAFIESHPHKQPDCPPELKNVFWSENY